MAGGRNGDEIGWPTVSATDCYDVETGVWTEEANIPQERAGSAYGTTCDGKLMIAGGEGFGQAWDNVDVFDGHSWATLNSLNVARHGTGLAVNCACNQIYIASGAAAQGGRAETKSVETFFVEGADVPCSL